MKKTLKLEVDILQLEQVQAQLEEIITHYNDIDNFHQALPQERANYYIIRVIYEKIQKKHNSMMLKRQMEASLKLDYIEAEVLAGVQMPLHYTLKDNITRLLI